MSLLHNLIARAHLDDLIMHGMNGTDVSWPYALCNDDPSPLLASSWSTSSTTNDFIVLNTPNVDPDDTAFPTYTPDLLTATS